MNDKDEAKERQTALPCYQVYACGPFLVKQWDGTSYQAVSTGAWGGSQYPRLLLKVLVSSPGRQASRGRLQEILWPDIDPEESNSYLNDAAYRLRSVLRPLKGGKSLLRTSKETSNYALVEQEHLWVDADAALALFEQVEGGEQQSDNALAVLEEATSYLSRGEFLAEEGHLTFYGRRARVARARRGCVLAQAKIYEQRGWLRRGEVLLSCLLEENALDEDALCALMLNFQQQGRTSEGLRLYKETKALLACEGLTPAEITQSTEQQIRSALPVPISRKPEVKEVRELHQFADTPLFLPFAQQSYEMLFPCSSTDPQDIMGEVKQEAFVPSECGVLVPPLASTIRLLEETEARDWPTWFGLKLTQLLADGGSLDGQLGLCLALQERLDQELKSMKPRPNDKVYTQSRRQALVTLAALPMTLLLPFQQGRLSAALMDQFLSHCSKSITACWHLLSGSEFTAVEEVIPRYLPVLTTILRHSSTYQQIAAHHATQCHLLMAMVKRHRWHDLKAGKWNCQQAVLYSEAAGDLNLTIAALKHSADMFYHAQCYADMLGSYEQAAHLMNTAPTLHEIPPLLRCRIYAGLADAYAKNGQVVAAEQSLTPLHDTFPAYLVDGQIPLYADCGVYSLYMWEGLVYLDFGKQTQQQNRYQQAGTVFAKAEQFSKPLIIPERIHLEIMTHQAATAIGLGNMEEFCTYVEKCAEGNRVIGSQRRRRELIEVYAQGVHAWPHEPAVQNLADVLVSV
ncbi:MAG: AfsR/SARP family transcriptional regulator [Ktedonobacteraceae bacterium]